VPSTSSARGTSQFHFEFNYGRNDRPVQKPALFGDVVQLVEGNRTASFAAISATENRWLSKAPKIVTRGDSFDNANVAAVGLTAN
jgi:hypothetical protein